jgi:hypothetical protein
MLETKVDPLFLARARRFLAPGFTMFPGSQRFTELEAMIDWAKPRRRWAKKRYERFDAAQGSTATHVDCFGTLHGEWNDGTAFEDIVSSTASPYAPAS